jgi:hypothetical protein
MVFRMFAYEIEDAAQSSVKGKTAAELIDPWFNYNQTPRDPALIAWSPEYDGNQDVEHEATFHDGTNEANPAFVSHRVSWRDDIGCLHFVRYDIPLEPFPTAIVDD